MVGRRVAAGGGTAVGFGGAGVGDGGATVATGRDVEVASGAIVAVLITCAVLAVAVGAPAVPPPVGVALDPGEGAAVVGRADVGVAGTDVVIEVVVAGGTVRMVVGRTGVAGGVQATTVAPARATSR